MSVLNMTTSRPFPETELEQISQLAVTLSGRLMRVPLDDIGPAIAEALQQVAAATCADGCQLVEFSELGAVAQTYLPTAAASGDCSRTQMPVLERLADQAPRRAARWWPSRGPRSFPSEAIVLRRADASDRGLLGPGCAGVGGRAGRLRAGDRQLPA